MGEIDWSTFTSEPDHWDEIADHETQRDRLWCEALIRKLDIDDVNAVLAEFIRLRHEGAARKGSA